MDWKKLLKLLPVVAGTMNPAAGAAAQLIIDEAETILAKKAAADPEFDRDAYLAEAQTKWDRNIAAGEDLLHAGHEKDS